MAALPVTMGSFKDDQGVMRTWVQGVVTGSTNGAMTIIGTISATLQFRLMKLMIMVHDPFGIADVAVNAKSTEIHRMGASSTSHFAMDFSPKGLVCNVANTTCVQAVISGATVGATVFANGFYE